MFDVSVITTANTVNELIVLCDVRSSSEGAETCEIETVWCRYCTDRIVLLQFDMHSLTECSL